MLCVTLCSGSYMFPPCISLTFWGYLYLLTGPVLCLFFPKPACVAACNAVSVCMLQATHFSSVYLRDVARFLRPFLCKISLRVLWATAILDSPLVIRFARSTRKNSSARSHKSCVTRPATGRLLGMHFRVIYFQFSSCSVFLLFFYSFRTSVSSPLSRTFLSHRLSTFLSLILHRYSYKLPNGSSILIFNISPCSLATKSFNVCGGA